MADRTCTARRNHEDRILFSAQVLGCAHMATNPPPLPINCAICGKSILPKDFNVTEAGKPVHGECWLAKVKERQSQN